MHAGHGESPPIPPPPHHTHTEGGRMEGLGEAAFSLCSVVHAQDVCVVQGCDERMRAAWVKVLHWCVVLCSRMWAVEIPADCSH